MYEYLSGTLSRRTPTEVVVDCGGVGYRVLVSLRTSEALARHCEREGQAHPTVRLWIQAQYTETDQRLFGFWTEMERELFRLLQGVRGVGPTLARAILSHESAEVLLERLRSGDSSGLTAVKGIGRKTAERMLVELKDRLPAPSRAVEGEPVPEEPALALAKALVSLGLAANEAQQVAERTLRDHPEETSLEAHLRIALRQRVQSASRGRS